MAGVVAGAGAGFHRMSLKPQRRLSKNKKGRTRRVIPNELEEDKIYLKSLILVRHLKIGA
jgi:hypothetical protein